MPGAKTPRPPAPKPDRYAWIALANTTAAIFMASIPAAREPAPGASDGLGEPERASKLELLRESREDGGEVMTELSSFMAQEQECHRVARSDRLRCHDPNPPLPEPIALKLRASGRSIHYEWLPRIPC